MSLPFKEIVDLGREMFHDMPNIGGAHVAFWPISSFKKLETISGGKLSMESRMMLMPEHCSTHLDVPRHCTAGATDVAGVPLERLVLPGHLLDLTHKRKREAITIRDLEEAEHRSGRRITGGSATLVWTGADEDWGKPGFTMDRPYLPVPTAKWLVERKITLFGTDLIGMDDPDEWWWPTHRVWLEAGICMVQQMCNLGALAGKEFLLVVAPLKLRDGTGCPVRPIALVT
jgi:kynurenine formamidase